MSSPSLSLKDLEELYSLRILVTLLAKKKMYRSALYQALTRSIRPVISRVNHLVAVGLIKETAPGIPPFYKELELTPKGVEVAKLVVEIEKVLRRQD